jgi:hypothetical protein
MQPELHFIAACLQAAVLMIDLPRGKYRGGALTILRRTCPSTSFDALSVQAGHLMKCSASSSRAFADGPAGIGASVDHFLGGSL